MIHTLIMGISAFCLAVWMPVVLLSPVEPTEATDKLLIVEPPMERQVQLQIGDSIQALPLEEYLTGVLMAEMPMSFEEEALKAQAVAARTFAMEQMEGGKHSEFDLCGKSDCCQAWMSPEMLQDKLGESWLTYWRKAEEAVSGTEGEVITYEGDLIDAVYFSCSGGTTEDAVAVWGGQVPYLQSVESPGEEQAAKFQSDASFSLQECREKLPEADLSGSPKTWLGMLTRTQGGGVDQLTIGGYAYDGTELRSRFGLNSTKFTAEIKQDQIVFHVQGYGHRVGMSQYGANAMAQAGKNYKEILSHYYTETRIEQK